MAKVRLIGNDDVLHAEGEISDDIFYDLGNLVRNERHYRYIGMRDGGKFTFKETTPPYSVMEF